VSGPIASTFRWQGEVDHASEWYCALKTTAGAYPALEALIRKLHPYEVPEIIATAIVAASQSYLQWIQAQVSHRP
jgi:periplasmic divalent cation tolerance protein